MRQLKERKSEKKTPVDVFIDRIETARDLMDRIHSALDDHLGVDPDNVSWAHAGDIGHVNELLEEITDFLKI
jgi:hypothetical protein